MSERHRVGLGLADVNRRARNDEARRDLAAALPDGTLTEPDDTGTFEAEVPAASEEQAVQLVFDAIASAGADDAVVILEHSEVRRHWEHGTGRPGERG